MAPPEKSWALVVDLAGEYHTKFGPLRYLFCKHVVSFPFRDGEPIPDGLLDQIYSFVVQHLLMGPILIHCQAGASRSVSVAYALLRRMYGLTHKTALARVQNPLLGPEFPAEATLQSARDWAEDALQEMVRHKRSGDH
jgi:hypothetical protein